ncbi:LAMI_0H03862g1_1 [Lachancea mirantina]|uniref:LAMI_0H03862g1_1 n=1 Tax=Lachancea mirantina TaxID=1230905 RepID=A0A1G4KEE6_9SACH|nr:LAMI_0H03862g1_1 [Lachancea mirantina]
MENVLSSGSPSKKQLSSWWKQIRNNPKSMSSDSLAVAKGMNKRPLLRSHSRSFNHAGASPERDMRSLDPSSEEYRSYRDSFLSNRHQFTGQVFGVSLTRSLSLASAEVIVQSELVSFGRIPILVAKCGAFLKAEGLKTSGIFRIAGNNKRVKELQYIFSTPPSYGAKFNNWDGFTVHDAASLLRRYLNNLTEPLIPLEMYEKFRQPLNERVRILKHLSSANAKNCDENEDETDQPETESIQRKKLRHKKRLTRDIRAAIKDYEILFGQLSSDYKQLLIYLLDLLSLFAQQADVNLMTARNLAAIFQPSILSHPQHDMNPKEYELSRFVIEFLIDYSYKLLPPLLKNSRTTSKSPSSKDVPQESPETSSLKAPVPQTIVTAEENTVVLPDVPQTPTGDANEVLEFSYLTPPDPSFLEKQKVLPKNRPHSKSLSYAHHPSDVIAGRRRVSRFSWLNRALSSDTGEFTGTEEEDDEEDGAQSPNSFTSGSVPKHHLSIPGMVRTMSGNSNFSGGARPTSPIASRPMEDMLHLAGARRFSGSERTSNPTLTDDERQARQNKRQSWFKRLRSRSRSGTRD